MGRKNKKKSKADTSSLAKQPESKQKKTIPKETSLSSSNVIETEASCSKSETSQPGSSLNLNIQQDSKKELRVNKLKQTKLDDFSDTTKNKNDSSVSQNQTLGRGVWEGNTKSREKDSYTTKAPCQTDRNSEKRSRSQSRNREYDDYVKFMKNFDGTYTKITEITCDLFDMDKSYSLAHCVAEDLTMGSGIAVRFSQTFKRREILYIQRQRQGGLAFLEDQGRYIYYLVTKRASNGKPTMLNMVSSLRKLQQHAKDNKVTQIAMPRIGCGLDRLEWSSIKPMIQFIFQTTDVLITVCNLKEPEETNINAKKSSTSPCFIVNVTHPLVQIEHGTIIVYLGYKDGHITDEIEALDKKFDIIKFYKQSTRTVGTIIHEFKKAGNYVLCGFIIEKHKRDSFDFMSFHNCVVALNKLNWKKGFEYNYIGINAFLEDSDEYIMPKIVNLLKQDLRGVDVYVCWSGEMEKFMPQSY